MMNKVALVYIGNIEICPYRSLYEEILQNHGIMYNVVFWERKKLTNNYPANYLYYSFPSDVNKKKVRKLGDFIKYFKWLRKIIKEAGFTNYVFLDTISGILGYLSGFHYKAKGMLEIRDYTYDCNPLFRYFEKNAVRKMDKVCISSPAFKFFLPKGIKYCIAHNLDERAFLYHRDKKTFNRKNESCILNLVYAGNIKYYEQQIKIIDELADDSRFNIIFHGIGPDYEKIKDYIDGHGYKNVFMTGYYSSSEKDKLYEDADIILNCYDIRLGKEIKFAISNKYYDGLIYHIPQIVERYGHKGEIVAKYEVGVAWNPEDGNLGDLVWKYYHNIDEETFNKKCDALMNEYYVEYCRYKETINDFIGACGTKTLT